MLTRFDSVFLSKKERVRTKKAMFIGGVTILLSALLCYLLFRKTYSAENADVKLKPAQKQGVSTLEDSNRVDELHVEVRLDFPRIVVVESKVEGVLEKRESILKNGQYVEKGQLLAQINNRIPFQQLLQTKQQLKAQLNQLLKSQATLDDFPLEKWRVFESLISPVQLLPSFPAVGSAAEQTSIDGFSILTLYQEAQALESSMKDYFLIAPQAGFLSHVQGQEGARISKNTVIARINDQQDTLIRCEVDAALAEKIQSSQTVLFQTDAFSTAVRVRPVQRKLKKKQVVLEIQLPTMYRKQLTKKVRPQLIIR
jgi:multidrug efflux pump subunit AcrA (membrane-fusion protein)